MTNSSLSDIKRFLTFPFTMFRASVHRNDREGRAGVTGVTGFPIKSGMTGVTGFPIESGMTKRGRE